MKASYFIWILTEDIKAPESALSQGQVRKTSKCNIVLRRHEGKCAEIRRERLIRSGMSFDFSKRHDSDHSSQHPDTLRRRSKRL